MSGLGIGFFFIWILNFGISWLNAWGVGRTWIESKAQGGFTHFVTWCAAIMSGCGFTWCYLFVLGYLAGTIHYHGHVLLAPRYVNAMIELGYLVIILPIIGSGIGITISSWQSFWRNRDFASGGIAAYNTFAQVYNTIDAIRAMPEILRDVTSVFDDDNRDSNTLVFLLVLLALAAGFFTTFTIIEHAARVKRLEVSAQMASLRR